MAADNYENRVAAALQGLGLSVADFSARNLPLCREPETLVVADIDIHGREQRLIPAAAAAWQALKASALKDGIVLQMVSAYRSLEQQTDIVRRKLARGDTAEQIFCVSAPPGYSEHHSGRALDLTTPDCPPLEEVFELTPAFAWLQRNARAFSLSYPRGNPQGYAYEPWHWFHAGADPDQPPLP